MEEELKKETEIFVLENAIKFKGKANPGAIIGKIIGSHPEFKDKKAELAKDIAKIVSEINKLSLDDQKERLLAYRPDYFDEQREKKKQRQQEEKELPPLKNAVEGKVKTRIAPEPSKYNHIGHAMSFLLNYQYSQIYKGKCVLRFEDTNPEKSTKEYVEAMETDVLEYLDISTDETIYVSDHMDMYYEYANKLVDEDKAYTCRCKSEDISKNRRNMEDCPCRAKDNKQVKEEWENMKAGKEKEGEITLRLKIDMKHKNAVMRDPVIFRLSYHTHYRQGDKYQVWPMYDFENAIEEGLMKVTHVLRSNEFQSRIELQDHIRSLFNLPNPEVKQYARFNITGAVTKGREIRDMIESGEYIGWDDPRLMTLRALKRRGIVKETMYELSKVIGMSKTTSNLDFSQIAAINRRILDAEAYRFFFISDYEKIKIEGAPEQNIELSLHPKLKKGGRFFQVKEDFYLSKDDLKEIKEGEIVRLMDCLNFIKQDNKFIFKSTEYEEFKEKGKLIIHWLPANDLVEASVRMPDNKIVKGLAESTIETLEEGDVIQFERFGFCRLDNKQKNEFWYTHN